MHPNPEVLTLSSKNPHPTSMANMVDQAMAHHNQHTKAQPIRDFYRRRMVHDLLAFWKRAQPTILEHETELSMWVCIFGSGPIIAVAKRTAPGQPTQHETWPLYSKSRKSEEEALSIVRTA